MTGAGMTGARRTGRSVPATEGGPVRWLAPLAAVYGGAVALRGWLYDRDWIRIDRLPVPVVSVGNLSVGGTGKSPMVALVARALADGGARPAIVSRGYGGAYDGAARVVSDGRGIIESALEVGDEPVMLARWLDGVPVIVSHRRGDGGRLAVGSLRAGCVVLDDGFQHRSLARALDLLLLDGAEPFGNLRLLPAGPLREPVSAMRRAGAIVITRSERSNPAALGEIARQAARFCPAAPIFHARSRPAALVDLHRGEPLPLETLRGRRVVCFAGIARPERFFQDVEATGAVLTKTVPFGDHHRFSAADLSSLAADAAAADLILTTEKDGARLAGTDGSRELTRLFALRLETTVDEAADFASLLRRAVP